MGYASKLTAFVATLSAPASIETVAVPGPVPVTDQVRVRVLSASLTAFLSAGWSNRRETLIA
eukprot:1736854-Rhodomonas_salina.1